MVASNVFGSCSKTARSQSSLQRSLDSPCKGVTSKLGSWLRFTIVTACCHEEAPPPPAWLQKNPARVRMQLCRQSKFPPQNPPATGTWLRRCDSVWARPQGKVCRPKAGGGRSEQPHTGFPVFHRDSGRT